MNFTLQNIAWHRSVGRLVKVLDAPDFWVRLVCLFKQYVPFDSWVALLFSQGRPQVFVECPGADGRPDPLFQDYLRGLYLFDPFYVVNRKNLCSGLFRLADVVPEYSEQIDYHQRYFHLNVMADEIQINVQLSSERTLYLSLGLRHHFTSEQLAVLGLARPWVARPMRQRLAFGDEVLSSPATPEPGWQGSPEKVAERMGTLLTTRELEVGRLMLSGCLGKETARKLTISAEIVKAHRKHMYGKLGTKSRSELLGLFLQAQG